MTLFDGSGTFEAYQNALEGQSLFTAETAVVLHNPPFLKRRSEKEDHREESFLETVKDLSPDILLIILLDGKPDKRTKIIKTLLSICTSEEYSLMNPRDAAGTMIRMLADAGKRVDYEARAIWRPFCLPGSRFLLPFSRRNVIKLC